MFPLTSNEAYIKSTGERSTLGKMLEEGGNEPIEAKLNDEIAARAALGAHQLLPIDLATLKSLNTNGVWNDNVYTHRGVDFTVATDSNGNITGITANGTATGGNCLFNLATNLTYDGNYIMSGCTGGTNGVYRLYLYTDDYSTQYSNYNGDTPMTFNNVSGLKAVIQVSDTKRVDNVVFKPLIRLSTDADTTFTPYALTNQELTTAISPVNSTDFTFSNATGNGYIYKDGHIGVISLDITPSDTADTTVTLPSGYTLAQNFYQKHTINSNTVYAYGYANGTTFKISHSNTDEIMMTLPVALK